LVPSFRRQNALSLKLAGWEGEKTCHFCVNGNLTATVTGAALATGLDLTALEDAPWCKGGRRLLESVKAGQSDEYGKWLKTLQSGPNDPGIKPAGGDPDIPPQPGKPVSYHVTITRGTEPGN
jgi:hypothetical protein